MPTDFYTSETAMHEALFRHTSFNIIDPHTGFKADVFVLDPGDLFNQSSFSRARLSQINQDTPQLFRLDTSEDVILHELKWYKAGGSTSDKQWNDILGVFKVQGTTKLDTPYLKLWADKLAVADLLVGAIQEASLLGLSLVTARRHPGVP